ncbi:type I glyceraldehyde-3-phosphate dehydrogenase [candidate division WOR-3 bacterium JGI_Cruoil_03_44_89]|uniref:Type I glyceraldehyde-3-phosphate dehydrogenase n=1 Tax=candidate division WOR-3 bacterium JGI_Cruoil_03_44_89 TaxID=1973748 RepID=A0A235BXK9_UNCW3|nr:MAG: type I glyceraldehyde-3-phosphate dehydrogenase [candidate division WOR-3 bacterium JGI_Cruoil_03_44_89]
MALKLGINGFGRIGRLVSRIAVKDGNIEIVGINDIVDTKILAHLFKYDSTYGILNMEVKAGNGAIFVDGKKIPTFMEREPNKIPWGDLGADIVVESTGKFRSRDRAALHLEAGAKKVIISAPAKGTPADCAIVMGVNEEVYDPSRHHIVDNASCTTNCFAPMVKILHDTFGMEKGFMTTIHSYTADQKLIDAPHRDMRRARAAANSIIPTTTGAAKAIGIIIPELKGKLDAMSVRVPTIDASLVDFVCVLKRETSKEEVNNAFREASGKNPRYIEYLTDELVSCDIIGNSHSMIFDPFETKVLGNLVKVLAWYDNEYGYASRVIDLAHYIGERL